MIKFLVLSLLFITLAAIPMAACSTPDANQTTTPDTTQTPTTVQAPDEGEEVIVWKMQSILPLTATDPRIGSSFPMVLQKYADWVADMSNGQLVIELLEPGAVAPPLESLNTVKMGALDAALSSPTFDEGVLGGITAIARGLPGMITTPKELRNYYQFTGVLDVIQDAYAEQNTFMVPALWSNDYNYFTTFPVASIDDFKGHKIRALGLDAAFIQKIGGAPVTTLATSDLYMAMKLGTVDGCAFGSVTALDVHFEEVAKYYIVEPAHYSVAELIINKDSLVALPDDIENDIIKYSEDILDIYTLDDDSRTIIRFEMLEEAGMELIRFSAEETKKYRQVQRDIVNDLIQDAQAKGDTYFLQAIELLKSSAMGNLRYLGE